jgi:hypothetical protein
VGISGPINARIRELLELKDSQAGTLDDRGMSMGRARQAGMAQLLLACLAVCWCTASGSEPAAGGDLVIKKATRYVIAQRALPAAEARSSGPG